MDTESRDGSDASAVKVEEHAGEGSGPIGLGIGIANVFLYSLLPALLIFGIWTFISIYAIVKWVGSAPDQANPTVLVVGIAWLLMSFLILFAAAISLIGRAMNPKKRAS